MDDTLLADAAMPLVLASRLGLDGVGQGGIVHITHVVPTLHKTTHKRLAVVLGARPPADGDALAEAEPPRACTSPSAASRQNSERESLLQKIDDLGKVAASPYFKARVADLVIRSFRNATGVILTIDLEDASGSIRGVAFGATAQRLYDKLRADDDIIVRGGRLKRADERFRRDHDFELTIDERCEVDVR